MLKDVILRQKQERERLLSLSYVERTRTAEAKKWLDTDLIKVVVGPRRAGKSIFSLMLLKDRPSAYFNFDDEAIVNYDEMALDKLMHELRVVYGETPYILFDEIQNIDRWEPFVNRLQRQGYNVVLTGSNAKLLSSELATALTGRHISIEILPFNFTEFLRAKQLDGSILRQPLRQAQDRSFDFAQDRTPDYALRASRFAKASQDKSTGKQDERFEKITFSEKEPLLRLVHEYLVNGGFPEVVIKNLDVHVYLGVLFDSLIFKDIVKRHNVRFTRQIDQLGTYFINNVAMPYSLRKLTNVLEFRSGVTLEKYLSYFVQAYILFSLTRYGNKTLERLKSPKKAYVVDNGFVAAKAVQHSPDNGKLMENLVFAELVKRGYQPNRELFYYKTRNDREIDFVLKKGTLVQELVQVAYGVDHQEAEQREIKALIEAAEEWSG